MLIFVTFTELFIKVRSIVLHFYSRRVSAALFTSLSETGMYGRSKSFSLIIGTFFFIFYNKLVGTIFSFFIIF